LLAAAWAGPNFQQQRWLFLEEGVRVGDGLLDRSR
jgi:hypothetical protein